MMPIQLSDISLRKEKSIWRRALLCRDGQVEEIYLRFKPESSWMEDRYEELHHWECNLFQTITNETILESNLFYENVLWNRYKLEGMKDLSFFAYESETKLPTCSIKCICDKDFHIVGTIIVTSMDEKKNLMYVDHKELSYIMIYPFILDKLEGGFSFIPQ